MQAGLGVWSNTLREVRTSDLDSELESLSPVTRGEDHINGDSDTPGRPHFWVTGSESASASSLRRQPELNSPSGPGCQRLDSEGLRHYGTDRGDSGSVTSDFDVTVE